MSDVGFSGTLHITPEQADRLTDYYNTLNTERGLMKQVRNARAIAAIDTALAAIGLRFVFWSTEEEGYCLAAIEQSP